MKKFFTSILFFFMAVCLTAETGYKGYQWYNTTAGQIDREQELTLEYQPTEDFSIYYHRTRILGELIPVYYSFFEDRLLSAGYILDYSQEKLEELLSRFEKPVFYRSYHEEDLGNPEELLEVAGNQSIAVFSISILTALYERGQVIQSYIMQSVFDSGEKEKVSDIEIYAIDYNQDTRAYIFSNIYEGKILVFYVEHPQDF